MFVSLSKIHKEMRKQFSGSGFPPKKNINKESLEILRQNSVIVLEHVNRKIARENHCDVTTFVSVCCMLTVSGLDC